MIVQVADSCRTCPPDRLVIPYAIFQQSLGDPKAGVAAVRYRQVECSPRASIDVDVDTFRATEGGYIRLDLQNVAGSGALASVELRQPVSAVRTRC